MLSLSPLKLAVVLLVALVLVGPDKLPGVARQIGGAWRAFRTFSTRIEEEVRSNMPDLPSTGDIAKFARSPLALLDSLADLEDVELTPDPGVKETESSDHLIVDPAAPASEEPKEQHPPDDAATHRNETVLADRSTEPPAQHVPPEAAPTNTSTRAAGSGPGGFDPSLN